MELPTDTPTPPLYSSRAIRGFSTIFSAIAGGLLLAQNLRDVGRPEAARNALLGSIGYTALMVWLTSYLPARMGGSSIGLVIGLAGGLGLNAYFEKILPNKDDFPAKSIRKPLLICLLIFVPIVAFVIYVISIGAETSGGHYAY